MGIREDMTASRLGPYPAPFHQLTVTFSMNLRAPMGTAYLKATSAIIVMIVGTTVMKSRVVRLHNG